MFCYETIFNSRTYIRPVWHDVRSEKCVEYAVQETDDCKADDGSYDDSEYYHMHWCLLFSYYYFLSPHLVSSIQA